MPAGHLPRGHNGSPHVEAAAGLKEALSTALLANARAVIDGVPCRGGVSVAASAESGGLRSLMPTSTRSLLPVFPRSRNRTGRRHAAVGHVDKPDRHVAGLLSSGPRLASARNATGLEHARASLPDVKNPGAAKISAGRKKGCGSTGDANSAGD
jgi:hypothetical protein